MTPIAATEILRVLQRGAEGQASVEVVGDDDFFWTLAIDGWQFCIGARRGRFGWIEHATAPDGSTATTGDWDAFGDPCDLLSDQHEKSLLFFAEAPRRALDAEYWRRHLEMQRLYNRDVPGS